MTNKLHFCWRCPEVFKNRRLLIKHFNRRHRAPPAPAPAARPPHMIRGGGRGRRRGGR